jgi:hypothetical protein
MAEATQKAAAPSSGKPAPAEALRIEDQALGGQEWLDRMHAPPMRKGARFLAGVAGGGETEDHGFEAIASALPGFEEAVPA